MITTLDDDITKDFYDSYYWNERKEGLYKPFGKKKGIESLIKAINNYDVKDTLRLLDIGCGEGHIIKYLSKSLKSKFEFHGLDRNLDVLSRAKSMLEMEKSIHKFKFIPKNIKDNKWADDLGGYDIVMSINTF